LVKIAVEVELEQGGRMVAGPPRRGGHHAGKTKGGQVEFVHESIDDPHRVVGTYVVVQTVRQQSHLTP
jgi:hypothetical protein